MKRESGISCGNLAGLRREGGTWRFRSLGERGYPETVGTGKVVLFSLGVEQRSRLSFNLLRACDERS